MLLLHLARHTRYHIYEMKHLGNILPLVSTSSLGPFKGLPDYSDRLRRQGPLQSLDVLAGLLGISRSTHGAVNPGCQGKEPSNGWPEVVGLAGKSNKMDWIPIS